MSDRVSEIFGYIVIVAAVVLFGWEYLTYTRREDEDNWLLTARRLRRRTIVSLVLLAIGVLVALEGRHVINLHNVVQLQFYVFTLGGLAVLLLVLAVLDLADTAKSASRHTMKEFEAAVEAEKRRLQAEREAQREP